MSRRRSVIKTFFASVFAVFGYFKGFGVALGSMFGYLTGHAVAKASYAGLEEKINETK